MTRGPGNPQNGHEKGLTGIPIRIHCAATEDGNHLHSEADQLVIENLVNTIAEIAMAVAGRQARSEDQEAL